MTDTPIPRSTQITVLNWSLVNLKIVSTSVIEHIDFFDTEEVTGSNPVSPTRKLQVEALISEDRDRGLDH